MSSRCHICCKKVGLLGFTCRCCDPSSEESDKNIVFCAEHRYPEKHGCTFDFKSSQQKEIVRKNPVVVKEKVTHF